MEPQRAAVYVRVSTMDQHPENQEMELRSYVEARGMQLSEVYTDRISGIRDSRPALDRLIADARKAQFDHVVIWKIDRLGRSALHFFEILDEWKNLGITYSISTLGVDTSTPTGRFVSGILMQVAELERQFIIDRINLGVRRMKADIKRQGFYITKDGRKLTSLGRPPGRKDRSPRPVNGYLLRYQKDRFSRRAQRKMAGRQRKAAREGPHGISD